jgi:peptidoglycan/xylan/chitin deacetylase (PgdA/CDA1 family)
MTIISIILAVENEVNSLTVCLDALMKQTLPITDFEVIVAAYHLDQPIHKLLSPYTEWLRLSYVESDSPHRSRAFNLGARAASGDAYLFLRDGVVPEHGCLEGHLKAQQSWGKCVVIGEVRIGFSENAKGFTQYVSEQMYGDYKPIKQGERISWKLCRTGNMSIQRDQFLNAGGFNDAQPVGEDEEICFRLVQENVPIVFSREAGGYLRASEDLDEVMKQIQKRAEADVMMFQRHPSMLPHLLLGRFNHLGIRGTILRRFLLFLSIHPLRLAASTYFLLKRKAYSEWHRFVYSYCYWYSVRAAASSEDFWKSLSRGPIILMYHSIGQSKEPWSEYIVPEKNFDRQMAWLSKKGYQVISLEQLISFRFEYRLPPGRSVIITFDDGYLDNREIAHRILRQYGFAATIFLVSQFVGKTNQWDRNGNLAGKPLMSWEMIRQMAQDGCRFGAHSRSHPYLTELAEDQIQNEVEGSRCDLQDKIGQPISTFAYPHGKYCQEVMSAVEQAGYSAACSSDSGVNDPAVPDLALRRAEIRGNYSLAGFAITLWIGQTRLLWRLLKGM